MSLSLPASQDASSSAAGPVRVAELMQQAAMMPREEFLERFPEPAVLVFTSLHPDDAGERFKTIGATISQDTSFIAGLVSPDTVVKWLRKRSEEYPGRITMGRSPASDLVISDPGVSRLHGWFTRDGGVTTFHDGGSRNGTKVDDRPVPRSESVVIEDGSAIRVGPGAELLYFEPATVYSMCVRLTS